MNNSQNVPVVATSADVNLTEEVREMFEAHNQGSNMNTSEWNATGGWSSIDGGRLDKEEMEGKDACHQGALNDVTASSRENFYNNSAGREDKMAGGYVDGLNDSDDCQIDEFGQGIRNTQDIQSFFAGDEDARMKCHVEVIDKKWSQTLKSYAKGQTAKALANDNIEQVDQWNELTGLAGRLRGQVLRFFMYVEVERGEFTVVEELTITERPYFNRLSHEGVTVEIPKGNFLQNKIDYNTHVMSYVNAEYAEAAALENADGFWNVFPASKERAPYMLSVSAIDIEQPWSQFSATIESMRLMTIKDNVWMRYAVKDNGTHVDGVMVDETYLQTFIGKSADVLPMGRIKPEVYKLRDQLADFNVMADIALIADQLALGTELMVLDAVVDVIPAEPKELNATSAYAFNPKEETVLRYYMDQFIVQEELDEEDQDTADQLDALKAAFVTKKREYAKQVIVRNLA